MRGRLFSESIAPLLTHVFQIIQDIIGDDAWLCNNYTGQRLSIAAFNENHRTKKIAKNYHRRARYPYVWWSYQIYIYHDFLREHPASPAASSLSVGSVLS